MAEVAVIVPEQSAAARPSLVDAVRRALEQTTDERLKAWLESLLAGEPRTSGHAAAGTNTAKVMDTLAEAGAV